MAGKGFNASITVSNGTFVRYELTRYAIVAVPEGGDLFTAEVVAEVVEAPEEVIEQPHLNLIDLVFESESRNM